MKYLTTISCVFVLTASLFGQEESRSLNGRKSVKELVGKWRCLASDSCFSDYWELKGNGRIEIVINCGGPCEGATDTSYVDEAGVWMLQGDSLQVTLNENNGKPYSGSAQIMWFSIDQPNSERLSIQELSGRFPYSLKFERLSK